MISRCCKIQTRCGYGGMVDALVSDASGATRGSSSLLSHTIFIK